MKSLRKQGIIFFTILALVLVACGGDAAEEVVEEATPEVVETLDSPAVTTAQTVKTGVGVTSDPCPEAVGSFPTGADPSKGCIYLGLINDYTGPYGALGPALELGQRAFWLWANQSGGVGDYSVTIAEGGDAQYNPAKHLEVYNSMRDDVAALAMSLGTPQTLFILDELDKDDMVAAPMSWYSGYGFKEFDKGLVVEFGSSYCAQGMNALDWSLENLPADIKTIGIIGNANESDIQAFNDYGINFGIAFQIIDDILDKIGDPTKIGKTLGKDEINNNKTYLSHYTIGESMKIADKYSEKAINSLNMFDQLPEVFINALDFIKSRKF